MVGPSDYKVLRFPPEMSNINQSRFPCVNFSAIKFVNRTFLTDTPIESSEVDLSSRIVPGTKIRQDSIWLGLPQDVTNSYSLNWEMADLRLIKGLVDSFEQPDLKSFFGQLGGTAASVFADRSAQIGFGKTPNPKKQALFNGIEPRVFNFKYVFTPQSLHEAELVQKVVESFVRSSLPSLESENDSFYEFPNEFEISFHNVTGYPKISSCVCTSVTTDFNPNNVALLQSGHPVQTSLILTFLETELLRKQKPGI
mgnify:CR=1 FL=1